MEWLMLGARVIFGTVMLVNGLNEFFKFFPLPPLSQKAQDFSAQLEVSGLMNVVKVLEVLIGIMMLGNIGVPAAIAMAMPISAIIFFVDVILLRSAVGYIAGTLILGLNILLLAGYSGYFLPLLTIHSEVTGWDGLRHLLLDGPKSV